VSPTDTEEHALLRESLAKALDATGDLRVAATEFGWFDLLAEDEEAAVATAAELAGDRLPAGSLLDDVMTSALDVDTSTCLLIPEPPRHEPAAAFAGDRLTATGVVSRPAGRVAVPVRHDDGIALVTVEAPDIGPAAGLDPAAGWRRVTVDAHAVSPPVPVDWPAMLAAGHRALAHELTAVGRRMLGSAVEHVATREQFGRRIGSFQAVQHLLADVRVWQDCAELAVAAAWEDGRADSACVAKILAGRFARTAAANCQQVLGGMGFTAEHEFHRYLRRALVLEPLLGSATRLRGVLGVRLRTHGVPRLAAL
jgi:acyl-CoA dehydrogenase-like protein